MRKIKYELWNWNDSRSRTSIKSLPYINHAEYLRAWDGIIWLKKEKKKNSLTKFVLSERREGEGRCYGISTYDSSEVSSQYKPELAGNFTFRRSDDNVGR